MKKLLILTLSIFVLTLASCGGGGGGSASPAIPQSTSPSAEFTPRSLSSSEVAELGEIVSTNQKSDETLQKLKEALEVIAKRALSADEVNTFYQFITAILSSTTPPTPPPTSDECEAGRILNDAGNACRLLNSTDCTAKGRILNDEGNACRPLTIADCPTGQIINETGNACRPLTNTDCDAKGQVIKDSGDSCRLLNSADCTAKGQILNAAGKACRPLTNADCEAESKILQHNSCVTPAPTDAECRSQNNQRLNAAGSACRPLTNTDCEADNKILQHNSCVVPEVSAPTDAECRSQNQRLNEAGSACRPLTNADCTDGKVLNTAGNACATPDPVEPEPPVEACGYYESVRDTVTGQCRPAKLEDCQAIGQVYVQWNGTCRPITNADCEADNKILQHNSCVTPEVSAPTDAECQAKGQVLNDAGNACLVLTEDERFAEIARLKLLQDQAEIEHLNIRIVANKNLIALYSREGESAYWLKKHQDRLRDKIALKTELQERNQIKDTPYPVTDLSPKGKTTAKISALLKIKRDTAEAIRQLEKLAVADCQAGEVLNDARSACIVPEVPAPTDAECRSQNNQRLNAARSACRVLTEDEQAAEQAEQAELARQAEIKSIRFTLSFQLYTFGKAISNKGKNSWSANRYRETTNKGIERLKELGDDAEVESICEENKDRQRESVKANGNYGYSKIGEDHVCYKAVTVTTTPTPSRCVTNQESANPREAYASRLCLLGLAIDRQGNHLHGVPVIRLIHEDVIKLRDRLNNPEVASICSEFSYAKSTRTHAGKTYEICDKPPALGEYTFETYGVTCSVGSDGYLKRGADGYTPDGLCKNYEIDFGTNGIGNQYDAYVSPSPVDEAAVAELRKGNGRLANSPYQCNSNVGMRQRREKGSSSDGRWLYSPVLNYSGHCIDPAKATEHQCNRASKDISEIYTKYDWKYSNNRCNFVARERDATIRVYVVDGYAVTVTVAGFLSYCSASSYKYVTDENGVQSCERIETEEECTAYNIADETRNWNWIPYEYGSGKRCFSSELLSPPSYYSRASSPLPTSDLFTRAQTGTRGTANPYLEVSGFQPFASFAEGTGVKFAHSTETFNMGATYTAKGLDREESFSAMFAYDIGTFNMGATYHNDKSYTAMFYKELTSNNRAFFTYNSIDATWVSGMDSHIDFYGDDKIRFLVYNEKNQDVYDTFYSAGYITTINDSDYIIGLRARDDFIYSAVFNITYDF